MTDARWPERWLNDWRLVRLSDRAHRLFAVGLLWSVTNRSDGEIPLDALAYLSGTDAAAAEELVKARLWARRKDSYEIADFRTTQTSSHELTVLENARRRERLKKQRQRLAKATGSVPWDGPSGQSHGTAQEGEAGEEGRLGNDGEAQHEDDWPRATQPPAALWPQDGRFDDVWDR